MSWPSEGGDGSVVGASLLAGPPVATAAMLAEGADCWQPARSNSVAATTSPRIPGPGLVPAKSNGNRMSLLCVGRRRSLWAVYRMAAGFRFALRLARQMMILA